MASLESIQAEKYFETIELKYGRKVLDSTYILYFFDIVEI